MNFQINPFMKKKTIKRKDMHSNFEKKIGLNIDRLEKNH